MTDDTTNPLLTLNARDGLTRLERIILWQLHTTEAERGRRVPTAMIYGRVAEHIEVSVDEFQATLQQLIGQRDWYV